MLSRFTIEVLRNHLAAVVRSQDGPPAFAGVTAERLGDFERAGRVVRLYQIGSTFSMSSRRKSGSSSDALKVHDRGVAQPPCGCGAISGWAPAFAGETAERLGAASYLRARSTIAIP
jgi:hypothetical protein